MNETTGKFEVYSFVNRMINDIWGTFDTHAQAEAHRIKTEKHLKKGE